MMIRPWIGTQHWKGMKGVFLVLCVFSFGIGGVQAQRHWDQDAWDALEYSKKTSFPDNRFTFCRIRYTSFNESAEHNTDGRWGIDYPESDAHFSMRLAELTTLEVPKRSDGTYEHAVVRLTDKELFDYPFVYLIEPGELVFEKKEIEALRSYLLRGGFMMVDDFWGVQEWNNWEMEISRVFPPKEYPIVDIPLTHPIFNIVFKLDEKPQVPTAWFWMRSGGRTSERADSDEVHYRGIYDKSGRLMIVICHNTDLGDGWEREGENEAYFKEISAKKAYPMGINIVVYAMTH